MNRCFAGAEYQSENRDGSMSHRTFYGGMHELSGGLDDAASGIHDLAKVSACLCMPPPMSMMTIFGNFTFVSDGTCPGECQFHMVSDGTHEGTYFEPLLQALHHVGDAFETIAQSFHTLAASVVDLKGAIQVSLLNVMTDYSPETARESGVPVAYLMCARDVVLHSH